jgi:enoyl-[acyl-carrier-protein] reductase (NADH)
MEDDTMLKQLPMMADIAYAALFLPSDLSAKITDVTIDVTAGTTDGLNY